MKTDKHTLTLDVDTSKIDDLAGLLGRLEAAAERLERLVANPPPNVEIVHVPDLQDLEITITSRVVS